MHSFVIFVLLLLDIATMHSAEYKQEMNNPVGVDQFPYQKFHDADKMSPKPFVSLQDQPAELATAIEPALASMFNQDRQGAS